MSTSARVLRDAEGEVSGAVVGLRDVTTEILMQNRIKRSEQLFRTAMVGAPQGMAISNAQDQLTDVNPALEAIFGAEKTAILGLRIKDFVVPAEPPNLTCAERLIASGEDRIVQHEHELIRTDGPPAWIEHSVSAIRDDEGRAMFFVHHVVDVTERRLREDDLGFRADHDVLTGLLNRDGLLTQLSERMPVRGQDRPCGAVLRPRQPEADQRRAWPCRRRRRARARSPVASTRTATRRRGRADRRR